MATTKEDDEGVEVVLRSIIRESYPPGTIGHGYLENAIAHIGKMRKEIDRLIRRNAE